MEYKSFIIIIIDDQRVEISSEVQWLEIIAGNKLNLNRHVNYFCKKKIQKKIGILQRFVCIKSQKLLVKKL